MPRVDSYCHTWAFYKDEPPPSKSREVIRKTIAQAKQNAIDAGNVYPVQQLFMRMSGALYRYIDAKDSDPKVGAQMQADCNLAAMVWQSEFSEWWQEFAGDESHLHPQTNPPPRVEVPVLKVLVNKPDGCVVVETKPDEQEEWAF